MPDDNDMDTNVPQGLRLDMPIDIDWDNPSKTIITCEFDAEWSWNDVFAMNREIEKMMDTVSHPVRVVIIMRGKKFPQSGTLTYTKHLFIHDHPNYANHVVFVGGNDLVKTFERIIRRAYVQAMNPIRSDYVETMGDARQLFHTQDM